MVPHASAREAACRLLAAAWNPQDLPAPETVPWSETMRLVEAAGLGGLLHVLTESVRASIPADTRHDLEQAFYHSAAASARCLHQLAQVRAALEGVGAPAVLLKGAALGEGLYGDVALRPIGDIDLLVRHQHVPACSQALLTLGYLPARLEERPDSLLALRNQQRFELPGPDHLPVELHWHIVDVPYYLHKVPIDWFWDNTQTLAVAGQPYQVLNPQANLLYLPAHLALHHRFRGLHSLLDLALLIVHHRGELDWQEIIATARSFELVSALTATLDRLAGCWPSLPIDEPRRLLDGVTPSPNDARLFRLLTAPSRSNTLDVYATLVSMPGLAARARYCWVNLFPQAAYMMRRYPIRQRWHLPYWYLYRLTYGLKRLVRILPQARRVERENH